MKAYFDDEIPCGLAETIRKTSLSPASNYLERLFSSLLSPLHHSIIHTCIDLEVVDFFQLVAVSARAFSSLHSDS